MYSHHTLSTYLRLSLFLSLSFFLFLGEFNVWLNIREP